MRFKSRSRALAAAALSASVGLAGLTLAAAPAQASEPTDVVRVAGTTRYGTAAEAATQAYPTGATNVVLASGEKFPDALAGGGLAGSLDAPILLATQNSVPAETQAALAELGADNVTILGGTEAISAAVEAGLEAAGLTVDRVGGEDRFETAAMIAEELGGDTAVLANGLNFPDALAISPGTHKLELPLLLTAGNALQEDAAAFLGQDTVTDVIIVGGTAVVPQSVEDALEADGKTVTRLAGATRYETSVEIAEFHTTVGFTLAEVVLATGEKFPDALAGGPYASQNNAPMVLTQTNTLTPATAAFLTENCQVIDTLHILGGTAAVSTAVETAAAAAARCTAGAGGVTSRPELVSAQVVSTDPVLGTSVRFVFDEAVNGAAANLANFFVWDNARTPYTADRAIVDPANSSAVIARFPGVLTPSTVATLTLATNLAGAVTDVTGQQSPIGDASLTPTGSAITAGATSAPDLVSVGNVRANGANTLVDYTFDEAVTTSDFNDFGIVRTNGTAAPASSYAAGNGTTTITVQYTGTITAADIARGFVLPGAAADAGADANPLQAADLSNGGNSASPDLVSVEYRPDAKAADGVTDIDQVLFTFDEAVAVTTATNFNVYKADSSEEPSTAAVRSTANATQVLATFPDGTLSSAVGTSVEPSAVTGTTGATLVNQPDEVALVGTGVTLTAGRTTAPDLIGAIRTPLTDPFGTPTGTAITYVFDEDVDLAAVPAVGDFKVYSATGAELSSGAASCSVGSTEDRDSTVTCVFGTDAGSAVLATVVRDAVNEQGGSTLGNPEGASPIGTAPAA